MNRREFTKNTGSGCIAMALGGQLFGSCAATKMIPVDILDKQITIGTNVFTDEKGKDRKYVILKPKMYDYPLVVYKKSPDEFTTLLLRCTHQGTELNVYGDLISCPAHGSEFSKVGNVANGPATDDLISFETTRDKESINIRLL